MSVLLDTDICSAHMRRPVRLAGKATLRRTQPPEPDELTLLIKEWDKEVRITIFDVACAACLGDARGSLLRQDDTVNPTDVLVANPGFRLEDWLTP